MGDGVLAYFGYPRADEHDAERAVRAGLARGIVHRILEDNVRGFGKSLLMPPPRTR
jgi:class 3 adenylate cyclase